MKPSSTEPKNCGESCGCGNKNDSTIIDKDKTSEKKPEKKVELDPTHFGDWQINGRTIDF
jgi:hypothetical protein